MSGPNLRRATLCSGLIAEQRLRQRAVKAREQLFGDESRIEQNPGLQALAAAPLARGFIEKAEARFGQKRQAERRRVALEELPFEFGGDAAEARKALPVETRHVADREAVRDRAKLDAEPVEGRDRKGVLQSVNTIAAEALAEAALVLARHFKVSSFEDVRADRKAEQVLAVGAFLLTLGFIALSGGFTVRGGGGRRSARPGRFVRQGWADGDSQGKRHETCPEQMLHGD